jgi:hypothetical protein
VLDFSGIGFREISINGLGSIYYISVGHDSKIYVADSYGTCLDVFAVFTIDNNASWFSRIVTK